MLLLQQMILDVIRQVYNNVVVAANDPGRDQSVLQPGPGRVSSLLPRQAPAEGEGDVWDLERLEGLPRVLAPHLYALQPVGDCD